MLGGGRITNGSALTLLHQAGLPLLLPCTFLPPGRIPARLSRLPAPKKKRREPALLFVRAADREKLQDIQPQSRGCSALHRGKPRSSCSRRFWKNTPASRSEPQRGSNPDIPYKPPTSTRIAPPPIHSLTQGWHSSDGVGAVPLPYLCPRTAPRPARRAAAPSWCGRCGRSDAQGGWRSAALAAGPGAGGGERAAAPPRGPGPAPAPPSPSASPATPGFVSPLGRTGAGKGAVRGGCWPGGRWLFSPSRAPRGFFAAPFWVPSVFLCFSMLDPTHLSLVLVILGFRDSLPPLLISCLPPLLRASLTYPLSTHTFQISLVHTHSLYPELPAWRDSPEYRTCPCTQHPCCRSDPSARTADPST